MVIAARPTSMIWLSRARFLALALLGLVVGHEAVYLAEYGPSYQAAMAATGHAYWLSFALLALVVGGIPLAAAGVGLIRLGASLRRLAGNAAAVAQPMAANAAPSYLSEVTGLFPRLFLVIVAGFTVQENVESLLSGHGVPGLWVLSSGMVLPVLLAISALIAVAGAWLRWREAVLERRIAAAHGDSAPARGIRATRAAAHWRDVAAVVAHEWLIARRLAGRAPPLAGAA